MQLSLEIHHETYAAYVTVNNMIRRPKNRLIPIAGCTYTNGHIYMHRVRFHLNNGRWSSRNYFKWWTIQMWNLTYLKEVLDHSAHCSGVNVRPAFVDAYTAHMLGVTNSSLIWIFPKYHCLNQRFKKQNSHLVFNLPQK